MGLTKKFILEALSEALQILIKEGQRSIIFDKDNNGAYFSYDCEKDRQRDIKDLSNAINKITRGTFDISDNSFANVSNAVFEKYCKEHPKSNKTDDDICCELFKRFSKNK